MKLVSIETNHAIKVGQVVEFLPNAGAPGSIIWVKIKAIESSSGTVRLASADGMIREDYGYQPNSIGAKFVSPQRPHSMTKKHAADIENKIADRKENSLGGGRCSSTGLSGDARRMMEDFAARGLTPTGRQPPKPEMQDLPARDMHGARAGVPQMRITDIDPAAGSFTIGPTYVFELDEKANLHSARRQILVDGPEFDAILAGLRLLAAALPEMQEDDGILDILTSAGEHAGLSAEEINELGDRLKGE